MIIPEINILPVKDTTILIVYLEHIYCMMMVRSLTSLKKDIVKLSERLVKRRGKISILSLVTKGHIVTAEYVYLYNILEREFNQYSMVQPNEYKSTIPSERISDNPKSSNKVPGGNNKQISTTEERNNSSFKGGRIFWNEEIRKRPCCCSPVKVGI